MLKMLAVISPAKTLDFDSIAPIDKSSEYRFSNQAHTLIKQLRTLPSTDIKAMMKLSDKLTELNVSRYHQWQIDMTPTNSKQALFAFKGDVYTGLNAETLTRPQIDRAQQRVRILSGLYGLLRPLDRIQPYRLEMGTRLKNEQGDHLYHYWGGQITDALAADIEQEQATVLINLASNEYFKAVQPSSLPVPVITPLFKDEKNGQYKIISFYAKKARGLMVRYLLENSLEQLSDLKAFNYGGYQYCDEESTSTDWVFKRKH